MKIFTHFGIRLPLIAGDSFHNIKDFWKEPVVSHWTAEDIAFCATLKVIRGIPSYVPDFSVEEERGDSDKHKYGVDHNVIKDPSHINKHFSERLKVIKHWIDRGWEPLQTCRL